MPIDGSSTARESRTASDATKAAPIESLRDRSNVMVGISLVVTEGESLGRRIAVGHVPVIIGRGTGADLQVRDPTVSRHHCVIWCLCGRCWVRDLGSTNTTRVNDRSALITELFDGDTVVMGHTVFTVSIVRQDDRAAARAHAPR